ncbi:MAG: acetylxylan esterase [Armatimonadota bacterium]
MKPLSAQLSRPTIADLGEPLKLEPLFPPGVEPTLAAWGELRDELLQRWRAVIGEPSFGEFERRAAIVERFEAPFFRGTVYRQPVGPDHWQQVLLMEPLEPLRHPRPAAVVPYYHPDLMAGFDLQTREPITDRPNVHFGRHLVQQGYVVACMEAFPYNTVPAPAEDVGFAWWQAGAEKLLADNPRWTGIGKLIWDTSRAVDLLLAQPDIDATRILAVGHSLGGKMAFYTAAFDERLQATIASDFGIGWEFTNWDAPWYFGAQVHDAGFTLGGHHALALIAPRSFLLIAGEADRPQSWQYLQQAQGVYRLYGREHAVGCFLHMTGHQPTEESIRTAWRWLAEQLDLPERPWRLEP